MFLKNQIEEKKFSQIPEQKLWQAYGLHWFSKLLGLVEIFVLAWALDSHLEFLHVLEFSISSVVMQALPHDLGVMEAGFAALAKLLSVAAPVIVSLQIMRRIRQIFWLGVGFVLSVPLVRD